MMRKKGKNYVWQFQHVWRKEKLLQSAATILTPSPVVIRDEDNNASRGPENTEEGRLTDGREVIDAGDIKITYSEGWYEWNLVLGGKKSPKPPPGGALRPAHTTGSSNKEAPVHKGDPANVGDTDSSEKSKTTRTNPTPKQNDWPT